MKTFKSLIEFSKAFDTDEKCRLYLEEQRWGGTPACCHCGSLNVCRFANNSGLFKCRDCRKKFTVTVGTVYQDRKLPLHKIFLAVYILSVHSKGISSLQLANILDISQKAAWLLSHKVRAMLKDGEKELLKGEIQVDATYYGGKRTNKHAWQRKALNEKYGVGYGEKTPVIGLLQKDGKVVAFKIHGEDTVMLKPIIKALVEKGATIMSDGHAGYKGLDKDYKHIVINHAQGIYVVDGKHTNSLEGFWGLLKRQINGIHHFVSPKHLNRYCDEAAYRYNNRKAAQDERFGIALTQCNGSLTWKELTADVE